MKKVGTNWPRTNWNWDKLTKVGTNWFGTNWTWDKLTCIPFGIYFPTIGLFFYSQTCLWLKTTWNTFNSWTINLFKIDKKHNGWRTIFKRNFLVHWSGLTTHSKNRATWLLSLLTQGLSEGKSGRLPKINPNFNISFPTTACSPTFH